MREQTSANARDARKCADRGALRNQPMASQRACGGAPSFGARAWKSQGAAGRRRHILDLALPREGTPASDTMASPIAVNRVSARLLRSERHPDRRAAALARPRGPDTLCRV
jgi:hypothetical protein